MTPVVHKTTRLYKDLYKISKGIPKRDKFGIYTKIENTCLDCLDLSIEATLLSKTEKIPILQKLRIKIELLKQLIRLLYELEIINSKKYFYLEQQLLKISKMATKWQQFLTNKGRI